MALATASIIDCKNPLQPERRCSSWYINVNYSPNVQEFAVEASHDPLSHVTLIPVGSHFILVTLQGAKTNEVDAEVSHFAWTSSEAFEAHTHVSDANSCTYATVTHYII